MKIHYCILFTIISIKLIAQPGSLKDPRDNKVYKTIRIGNQTWFAENLRFSTVGVVQPKPGTEDNYGLFYTWETAQKACPAGWHRPNEDEWKILISGLGGKYAAGGKMKSNSPDWKAPNKVFPTNSGFNAVPVGAITGGTHKLFSESALFWSSEAECTSANTVVLTHGANFIDKKIVPKTDLLSIRCLKNP